MNTLQDATSKRDTPLLDVRGLTVTFKGDGREGLAINDVSFSLRRGRILGLVGESGSGKSVTGLSIMGLIERPGRIAAGQILFDGTDLAKLSDDQMRAWRGKRIAMIFQDPMMTLNPVLQISTQMVEAVLAHDNVSYTEARARARDALGQVGIPRPEERLDSYPHEFSGGMRQRVSIAIALLHRPDLIIADEPTTALDVTIQAQILAEVQQLTDRFGTALIWVTHDLSIVCGLADEIAVMYGGKIVEYGPVEDVIRHPRHRYTSGLLHSVPSRNGRGERLFQIPGSAPSIFAMPDGCAFRPRCPAADQACRTAIPDFLRDGRQIHSCIHPVEGELTR